MACTSPCTNCASTKSGFHLVRYGGGFDNPSEPVLHIGPNNTVNVHDLLLVPAAGSQLITVVTATGDYGVNGTDFLFGTALTCADTTDGSTNFNFEVQRIRDGHQYRLKMLNPAVMATQALVDAYVGTRTLAHFDATTKEWTINNTIAAGSEVNTFLVVGGNAADESLVVEIVQ